MKNTILKYPNKKSHCFDIITVEVTKCLPLKAIILLTYIINLILRLSTWTFPYRVMFVKPNKTLYSPDSYRLISSLPFFFFSKICERLILQIMSPHIIANNILLLFQFGLRAKHSTIHQVSTSLVRKQYYSCVFHDVSQTFNQVWHDGLLYKLLNFLLPSTIFFNQILPYMSSMSN